MLNRKILIPKNKAGLKLNRPSKLPLPNWINIRLTIITYVRFVQVPLLGSDSGAAGALLACACFG